MQLYLTTGEGYRLFRRVLFIAVVAGSATLAPHVACAQTEASLPVLTAPQIFAPGVVSGPANDGSPTFSPDGTTLFFARSSSWGIILESHRTNGAWSQPVVAPFSGKWDDWAPEFTPDGRYLVYVSVRKRVANLWRVDRNGTGWGAPYRLPSTVNIGPSIWKSSIAADGSIYFVSIDARGGKRLYCSRFTRGSYQLAQPLSFSNGKLGDVDPEVAPDESFIVFSSNGRVAGDRKDHLFIAFKKSGAWERPISIRYAGDDANGYSADDEPHFSPDHSTLYFSSDRLVPVQFPRTRAQAQSDLDRMQRWNNGNGNVWALPLTPLVNAGKLRAGTRPSTARLRRFAQDDTRWRTAGDVRNTAWVAAGRAWLLGVRGC